MPQDAPSLAVTLPEELALARVQNSIEGTVAYAVERDGVPLGLLVNYVAESPTVWWAYARYTRTARLIAVAGSPFGRAQDAMDAVERAVSQHPGKVIAA